MHLLQPQTEVNKKSLVSTLSTVHFDISPDQVQRLEWANLQSETEQVDWLILHFNYWFSHLNVNLIRGEDEPEYFPATEQQPARIQFAHGFFNSALHEISHWTIAGEQRRLLPDLGYWYAPDGRTQEQQALFEQVEIKPQAIETFKDNVYAQVQRYCSGEVALPRDAKYFIDCICACTRSGKTLQSDEFQREMLD